jgi:hypothetical protein
LNRTPGKLEGAALVVAIATLAAWLGMLGLLAYRTSATEVEWARLFAVLGSLEAVAFAAAGALFGSSIQRQRVMEARERAAIAEGRASEAERMAAIKTQAAANGKALASAVKAHAQVAALGKQQIVPDELVNLTNQLFPE